MREVSLDSTNTIFGDMVVFGIFGDFLDLYNIFLYEGLILIFS